MRTISPPSYLMHRVTAMEDKLLQVMSVNEICDRSLSPMKNYYNDEYVDKDVSKPLLSIMESMFGC